MFDSVLNTLLFNLLNAQGVIHLVSTQNFRETNFSYPLIAAIFLWAFKKPFDKYVRIGEEINFSKSFTYVLNELLPKLTVKTPE